MKRIFLLLAVVGLASFDVPAAGMNLLELVGLGANGDSGARQESKGQRRQPIRVERETTSQNAVTNNAVEVSPTVTADFAEQVVTNVIDRVATNFVYRVATNFVDRIVTNVIDRVATNYVDRVATNFVDRVTTNYVDRVATNFVDRVATNFVDRIVTNVIERVVTNDLAEAVATNNVELVAPKREPGPPRITSNKVYYDRKEGYAVFTGKVHVDSEEYQLHAKKAYVFFEGTNELKRIVASGNVVITNETRRAYGTKASYYRNTGMVVLYGDDKSPAEVRDEAKDESQTVKGSKIKFWTTSEQVEVVDANISAPVSGGVESVKKELLPK